LGPLVLTLENKGTSEGRPLQEIKVHTSQARYLNAPNLLDEPLERFATITFDHLNKGDYYLTVIRKTLALPNSDLIALTTAEPLALQGGHVVVWVFDESFRVFDAVSTRDAGVADAHVNLSDAGADLTDAGADADLADANSDLINSDLINSDLTNTDLTNTDTDADADLTDTDTNADLADAGADETSPDGA
ncbi:MAG: hypothetical protein JRH20_19095, partial [Deltaproteobacteria bacterium]|nr:hypothetical protein [Deltaproteobacteria bacterium]